LGWTITTMRGASPRPLHPKHGGALMSKSKHRRRWTLESRKPASFPFPTDRELVWVCVGTDRSTGDSLGPFVGTMLTEAGVPNVYGTLDHPVNAFNLAETLERIKEAHPDACIVGIDACLGKAKSVGSMNLRDGALEPGTGVSKVLPSVGDYNIVGVVNVGGFMEYVVLQSTRLSLVIQMAKSITDFILRSLEARTIEQVAATREQFHKHMEVAK
jgi:putative sporulation protein YyaC